MVKHSRRTPPEGVRFVKLPDALHFALEPSPQAAAPVRRPFVRSVGHPKPTARTQGIGQAPCPAAAPAADRSTSRPNVRPVLCLPSLRISDVGCSSLRLRELAALTHPHSVEDTLRSNPRSLCPPLPALLTLATERKAGNRPLPARCCSAIPGHSGWSGRALTPWQATGKASGLEAPVSSQFSTESSWCSSSVLARSSHLCSSTRSARSTPFVAR
jgi:hypothetical protein